MKRFCDIKLDNMIKEIFDSIKRIYRQKKQKLESL